MNFIYFAIGTLLFLYIVGSVIDNEEPSKLEILVVWVALIIVFILGVRIFQ